MYEKGIGNEDDKIQMEWMKEVEKEKVQHGQEPPAGSIVRKHKAGEKHGFSNIASCPADIHPVHLKESRGGPAVHNRIRLIFCHTT